MRIERLLGACDNSDCETCGMSLASERRKTLETPARSRL